MFVPALNTLAWILATHPNATIRNGREAVQLAERAVRGLGQPNRAFLDTLAAAYAEAGRFSDAVNAAQQAIEAARQQNDPVGVQQCEERLKLYQQRQPLRQ